MRKLLVIPAVSLLMLGGCEADNAASDKSGGTVLATVGGSEIYRSQLDLLIERLPEAARNDIDAETRRKMIESLVRIRALALTAEAQLSEVEKQRLNARIQAYRDELLAQQYLEMNVTPQPVTAEMVKDYYDTHPDEFTEQGALHFEYLASTGEALDEQTRRKLLAVLAEAENSDRWKEYADRHRRLGLPVEYKTAKLKPAQIPEPIRQTVLTLAAGGISGVVYDEQKIHRIKLLDKEEDVVKTLSDVSADIRKKLAPLQLKRSLDVAVKQVLGDMQVEYAEQP